MITYNGIELDYKEDALSGLVIKGGLTKIENLTDRTGTASTQFTLPRTAKNELAFGNITTEGAQTQTSGEAYITIEGNIFSKGVLYVTGYDNDNFKCLFMGQDNDLIGTLKAKPLKSLVDVNNTFVLTDATIRTKLSNFVSGTTLGEDIQFHFGSPFLIALENDGILDKDHVAPFCTVRSMLHKMFKDEGYNLISNFFDSDYGQAIDYSNFGSSDSSLSNNLFTNGTNILPSSVDTSVPPASTYAGGYSYGFGLGTANANNQSIFVRNPPHLGAGDIFLTGNKYQLTRQGDIVKMSGVINYQSIPEIESAQIVIYIDDNQFAVLEDTDEIENTANLLQDGLNYFNCTISDGVGAFDNIAIGVKLNFKTLGGVIDLSNASIISQEFTISTTPRELNDNVWIGDYFGNETQLEFLKGILKDLNLVMDVEGDNVYIELQDEGIEPVGSTPATLPSIATSQYDITNIVLDETVTDIEYIQADTVYLEQKLRETNYTQLSDNLKYQRWGSFFYELNTFNNNKLETIESYFTAMYDGSSYEHKINTYATQTYEYFETWENNLSCRYRHNDAGFNGVNSFDYTNDDATTTSVAAYLNWSLPVTFAKTWNKLFINTLNQKKNNKIIEVTFKDELGTIVSNRREYIYKDQVYKIVEWSYDIIKRLVKAKLIMK